MTLEYKVLEARPTPINPNLNGQPFAGINGTASTPASQPTSASFIGAQTPTAGNVPSQIPSAQQSSNMAAHFKNI
jgi:hypothetical protein